MKVFNILLLASLSILFIACGPSKNTINKTGKIQDLEGLWRLQDKNETATGIGNNPITLVFDPTTINDITGFSGCNNYGANVTAFNGTITISNIYSTKMACPNLDVEQNYLDLLSQANHFEINKNDLYLYRNKLLLLHFSK